MDLAEKIRRYANSKPTNKDAHDKVKHDFFSDISQLLENKTFTVAELTKRLAELEENDRYLLFYRGRKCGNTLKEKASINSEAAQLILELYRAHNIPLTELDLAIIVTEGLTLENEKSLNSYRYRYWQRQPLSKRGIANLEHELIGLLKLERTEKLSLAEMLLLEPKELKNKLFQLRDLAPAYFPEVIYQLYGLHYRESYKTDDFIALLVEMSNEGYGLIVGPDKSLIKILAAANVELAAVLVKGKLQDYFDLSPAMQNAVFSFLEEKKDFKTIGALSLQLKGYSDEWPFPLKTDLQGIDRKQLIALLDNSEVRLRASAGNGTFDETKTFNQLVRGISQKAFSDMPSAIIFPYLQVNPAVLAINNYLKEGPNGFKTSFFANLAEAIKKEGLSVELLQGHLKTDRRALFAKWNGPDHSRAAALMKELYKLASLGKELDSSEVYHMIIHGSLPAVANDFQSKIGEHLNQKVRDLIIHPERANNSSVHRKIADAFGYYQAVQQFHHREQAVKQKNAEAIYQQYLLEKGLTLAEEQEPATFDPQGHVLVTVSLTADDYIEIVKQIQGFESITKTEWLELSKSSPKEELEKLLGTKLTDASFCNFDIGKHEALLAKFKDSVNQNETLDDNIFKLYFNSWDRGSVIPLQEEMSMHIDLSMRAIEKLIAEKNHQLSPTKLLNEEGRKQLFQAINNLVLAKFNQILKASYQSNAINYELINKKLDAARAELAPQCRQWLVDTVSAEKILEDILPYLNDEFFTSTTATGLDYLRTDASNETVVRISATEKTAHNKKIGADEQALRVISRNHYNPEAEAAITAYPFNPVEARVPSIADKDVNHSKAVKDVAKKLDRSQQRLREKMGGYRGPLIYNLLTSLHNQAYNALPWERPNKQRTSAARILKGSHLYNVQQLEKGEKEALVYVQNVPVNQHTRSLDMHSIDSATAEAALMTEVALLATMKYHAAVFPPALRANISKTQDVIHAAYLRFLPAAKDGDHYFKDSVHGKQAIVTLESQKKIWQQSKNMEPADNLQKLAVQVLFKMMVNNEHQHKKYGMLFQALSVFVEPMSQAGCKSANERYQAVAGRVELLKSISGIKDPEKLSHFHQGIINTFKAFVDGRRTADALQEAVDKAYNKHNLYGTSSFSEEDQGASSKVKATANTEERGKISEFDTNYAETNFLTRLAQKFAASMQAHKAHLAEVFKTLFSKVEVVAEPEEGFKLI